MKHTPGPWSIEPLDRRKYYGTKISLPGGSFVVVWTGRGEQPSSREIANGWRPACGMDHVETAEDYANALLIAAAPELLASLKWAMGHLEEVGGTDNPDFVAAREAIAKAEGREPETRQCRPLQQPAKRSACTRRTRNCWRR